MLTKTVEINGCKATFHTETGLDLVRLRTLLRKVVSDDDLENDLWYDFGMILVQSVDSAGKTTVEVPFAWPEVTDDIAKLKAARDAFFALPAGVYSAFDAAIKEVNAAPQETDLYPADPKKE